MQRLTRSSVSCPATIAESIASSIAGTIDFPLAVAASLICFSNSSNGFILRWLLGSDQPCRFGKTAHDVEALNSLAAGAFDDIVQRADHDEPSSAGVQSPGDFNKIGADHVLRVWQCVVFQQTNKGAVRIKGFIAGGDLLVQFVQLSRVGKMVPRREIEGGEDAAIDRNQMR